MENRNGFNKKKILMVVVGALAITAVLGVAIFGAMKSDKKGAKKIVSEIEAGLSDEEEAELDGYVNKAIDSYIADFSKQKSFSEVMTTEDKAALGKDILTELSKDMTEEQLTQMKEILVKIFSDDSTMTITGSAYFTDETKAYISQNIRTAVHDAIAGYSTDGGEHYTELQTTVERIVAESVGNGNVGYTLSQTDLDNLRQSVLSSLGNLNGASGLNGIDGINGSAGAAGSSGLAGKDGKDGRDGIDGKDGKDGIDGKNGENGKDGEDGKNGIDGRDGRDGKDGVNGTNGQDGRDGKDGYTPVKGTDYFTEKEIDAIIETITSQTEKYVDKKEVDATAAITASIQKSVTDVFNEALNKATEEYRIGISNLDSKLTEEINVNVTTLEETIGTLEGSVNTRLDEIVAAVNDKFSKTDAKVTKLTEDTDSKIKALTDSTDAKIKEIEDNRTTYELVSNGDGTFTLKITDPESAGAQAK